MDKITELCTELAEKIPQLYPKGKQDEREEFWDAFHLSSTYVGRFAGAGWRTETFRPTKDINIGEFSNANYCFYYNACAADLVELCNQLGISITIKPYSVLSMFQGSKFTRLPEMDVTVAATLSSTFAYCDKLVTIDKLILREDGTNTFSSAFYDCKSLKNLTIEGTIGQDGLNFQWSPLTPESMISVITHLFNFGFGTEYEQYIYTKTIKFSNECWNALNEYSKPPDVMGNPDADWRDYVSYLGWNT